MASLRRLACGLACASVLGCGAADPDLATLHARIFAGTPVASDEWPGVVALGSCSGVLINERRVAYAAHCGTHLAEVVFGNDVEAPLRRVPVATCRAHPQAALGNGRDVAYCDLSAPVTDVPALGLLGEAQVHELEAGMPVTLVGFGAATEGGTFGIKREAPAELIATSENLVIGAPGQGTCLGDSGGPALARLDDMDPKAPAEWRVIGLLSAGRSYACESGESYYSNVAGVRAFLASESSGSDEVAPSTPERMSGGCSAARSRGHSPTAVAVNFVFWVLVRRRGRRATRAEAALSA